MATRQAEPPVHPTPAGCAVHERRDWLPAGVPLDWFEELKARHVELAQAWAGAVVRLGEIRDDATEQEAEYRRAVNRALASGVEIPARTGDLDPARRDALLAVAFEDAVDAHDDLSEFVLEVLSSLRARRQELRPHLRLLSPELLTALSAGSADQRSIVAERLRRQADEIDANPIETVGDDEEEPGNV